MIRVTKPFLPPIREVENLLNSIWKKNWLTNNGPILRELEIKLDNYLGTKNGVIVANGTMALQLAIKALNLKRNVITTPISYVATTSSLLWEGCNAIFVDIDPSTLNIDCSKIEDNIDKNTQAILATHCFGNPCNIDEIEKIAKKHNLKVIYDAAHCFGTKYKGKTIYNYGDISISSFHATKLYHMVDGGGIYSNNPELIDKLKIMRNFGHNGPENFSLLGINAKTLNYIQQLG